MAILNTTLVPHTLAPRRDYDLSAVSFRSMSSILEQLQRHDGRSVSLVLTKGGEAVGHLVLELTESSGYIYDLAVAEEHWGGKAVLHIMRAGSRQLFGMNLPWLIGDVSAANPRALKTAQRNLGFAVDSERFGYRL